MQILGNGSDKHNYKEQEEKGKVSEQIQEMGRKKGASTLSKSQHLDQSLAKQNTVFRFTTVLYYKNSEVLKVPSTA
ncbi:hypothetical protein ACQP3J_31745, partial [Escherichia coli]